MQILNIAGYKFISLSHDIHALREQFFASASELKIKGTILLSHEGINLNVAGTPSAITAFKERLKENTLFADLSFHETYSDHLPFNVLKVKIKKEIITMKQPEACPLGSRAPSISPQELKQWLDEKRDITLLDTRNDYEVRFGTFAGATHLQLKDFGEFPAALDQVDKDKPLVMFCTGGIRCEKAAVYMLNKGHSNIYQLDGGILGYFAQVGGEHYNGECFVFDERVAVDTELKDTDTLQCLVCQGPVTQEQQQSLDFVPGVSCPTCA